VLKSWSKEVCRNTKGSVLLYYNYQVLDRAGESGKSLLEKALFLPVEFKWEQLEKETFSLVVIGLAIATGCLVFMGT